MREHEHFMQRALALAEHGLGHTSPNPVVGAVIVRQGQILGEGYHRQAGCAHAEVEALAAAGEAARGATLYVTLEPCNHHGRTPPCTNAILDAGIAELFYAMVDPNPHVVGHGRQRLVEAGVKVHEGLCAAEARHLNRFFFHYVTSGRPYVMAKFAASLDGKIATRNGESQWITGPEARQQGHLLRQAVDAILLGAGTAIADNPRLTTRLTQDDVRHPLRIVLDSHGRVPLTAQLFSPELPGRTMVATTAAMPAAHQAALERQQVETMMLPTTPTGQVDLEQLLIALGHRQILSLLVEGGGQVLGSFFDAGLVNEVYTFLAPLIIGGAGAPSPVEGFGPAKLALARQLQNVSIAQVGNDFMIRGVVETTRCSPELLKK